MKTTRIGRYWPDWTSCGPSDLTETKSGKNGGIDFEVRVGINTGLVVVGEVGSDLRLEYTALGDAINVAARMESARASPDQCRSQRIPKLLLPLSSTSKTWVRRKSKEERPRSTVQSVRTEGTAREGARNHRT